MSRIFNYHAPKVARIYDQLRIPQGIDVIAGLLRVLCGKSLSRLHVLDAGCGTGHHAKSLVDMGIGKLTLLDASPEMLYVAKEKLHYAIKSNTVGGIVESKFPPFPFDDRTFDAVMFNQCLHHVESSRDGQNYPLLEKTLDETQRILRKDGLLILSTVLSSTIRESVWFLQLEPGTKEMLANCLMPVDKILNVFPKHGFQCVCGMNLLTIGGSNIYTNFLDPESPLNMEWRQASCMFDNTSDQEIQEMEKKLQDKKRNGTLAKFVRENDHTAERGFITIFAFKSNTTR